MNAVTKDGQADRYLYLEQISPFWEILFRGRAGKGLEETALGDKGEERRRKIKNPTQP